MEWIGCVRCEKSWRDFVALCFSSSFMQLRNDPKCTKPLCNERKHEFRVQWNGLGAFVAKNPDVTSLHELLHKCTSSPCFASSFMQLRKDPKCIPTLLNAPKHDFRVQWGRLGASVVKKSRCDFVAWTFALIAPVHPVLHQVSYSYEMIPNAAKHYATHQNMCLGSNGADWVCSLRKIPTWLRGRNFCINLHQLTPFCAEIHVVRKRSQMHPNTMQRTKTWV